MAFLVVRKWRRFFTAAKNNTRIWLHNGPDTVDELLERHLVKDEKKNEEENDLVARQRLHTTRREALGLYRDIIRATRFFLWPNDRGVLWRDVLRENARREFEEARFERDPEVITRLLIGGHDSVQAALDKLVEKQKRIIEQKNENENRVDLTVNPSLTRVVFYFDCIVIFNGAIIWAPMFRTNLVERDVEEIGDNLEDEDSLRWFLKEDGRVLNQFVI